jgi:hypothetical protein
VQERIQNQFARIALYQALSIQPDTCTKYNDNLEAGVVHDIIDGNFEYYCGLSSTLQLNVWAESISSNSPLMELYEELLDPYRPAYPDLGYLLYIAEDKLDITSMSDFFGDFQCWSITWVSIPDSSSVVFLSFLLVSGFSNTSHLAIAFAKNHAMLAILTQQLR